jgi:hypothetical protein
MHISEHFSRTLSFIFALLLLLIGSVIGYLVGNWGLAIAIDAVLLLAILILRPILFPPWHEHSQIRTLILTIFATAASTFGLWDSIVPVIVGWVFSILGLPAPEFPTIWQQIVILAIVGIILVLISNAFERKQVLSQPSIQPTGDQSEAFPKTDYKELRDRFCDYMVTVLNKIDEEVNWSDSDFTILEAEVVVEKSGSSRPKIARDLVAAIRDDRKTRTFILIGDPGSGKSVSLRRLTRELYSKVSETGIVPLYINLREWDGPREPTDNDIVEFISRYLLRVSGRTGQSFLKNWYEQMLSQGLFFFLLDSFDEIPVVMDCDDRSLELKKISEAFDRFFHDIHQCRGVLSSRPFRQPVGVRGRRLNVRPFTETQIRKAMKKWLKGWNIDADAIIRKIFVERPELAPAIRNPFMADLISQYVISFPDKLPSTYYELYEHYVSKRLNDDVDFLKQLSLSTSDVIMAATQIASTMYDTPDTGLEIESSRLEQLIGDPKLSQKIKAMSFSRIARLGGIGRDRFTFVHRRFAEFFAVRAIHENNTKIDLTSIPSDSRWRDALVVYSGIAPMERIEELAFFSWNIIKENKKSFEVGNFQNAIPAIHSLRFLRDACQARPESIKGFVDELSNFIVDTIKSNDLLIAKIGAEALPLIKPEARTKGIEIAFTRGLSWLSETALRSCRHIAKLEKPIISKVQEYIRKLPPVDFFLFFPDLNFSLSLSDSLRLVQIDLWLQIISLGILWSSLFFTFFIDIKMPLLLLMFAMVLELGLLLIRSPISKYIVLLRFLFGEMRLGLDTTLRIVLLLFGIMISVIPIIRIFTPSTSNPKLPPIYGILLVLIAIPLNIWFSLFYDLRNNLVKFSHSLINLFKKRINIVESLGNLFGIAITVLIVYFSNRIILSDFVVRIFYVVLTVLVLVFVIPIICKELMKFLREIRNVNNMVREDYITWSLLCQTANTFQTDWGQARYFEFIRNHKINVTDIVFDSEQPIRRGIKSEQQFARLREQIYGLQE